MSKNESTGINAQASPPQGKRLLLITALLILLMLSGCTSITASQSSEPEAPKEIVPTGILVPTAEYTQIALTEPFASDYCWVGESLIYMESTYISEKKLSQDTIYQASLDAGSDPTALYEPAPGTFINLFFTDQDASLYLLCRTGYGDTLLCFLRKQDASGQEIYSVTLKKELSDIAQNTQFGASGYADAQGRSCIRSADGTLYFFDENGQYLNSCATELTSGKFLDAGEKGVYLWQQSFDSYQIITFQNVDMEKGSVSAPVMLDLSADFGSIYNYNFLSGYENGILMSETSALWQYDPDTGALTQILDWNTPSLAIDGYQVQGIRFTGADIRGADAEEPVMELLLYDQSAAVAESALVSYIDQAYLPDREKVVLGARSEYSYNLNRIIRQFNRNSREYYVQLQEYDNHQLEEALMYGGEEVPDMLDLHMISSDLLAGLGLLEDLEPYFEKSALLDREDFLDGFWEGGRIDGKLCGAIISFSLSTYVTTSDTMPADGWSTEDLLRLSEENPDSRLLYYQSNDTLFNLLFQQDQFINWSDRTCSFDSPEFIELLEAISSIPQPADNSVSTSYYQSELLNRFMKGEFMLQRDSYYSPYSYQTAWSTYRNKAYNIGFPSPEGEISFLMSPIAELSIYSNSSCKEGAWAFIEYLLTLDAQTWYGSSGRGFPVRRDAFEAYLSRQYHPAYSFQGDIHLEENDEQLLYMTEHMTCESNVFYNAIGDILSEELPAFYAGDKSAGEVAAIIQSRAQLYLDEQ